MQLSRLAAPRRLAALLVAPLLLAPIALAQPAAAVSPDLVISQVYGGGGNSGATLTNDFIEIFNRGSSPASLSGMSLQYASATGTGNFGANSGQLTELPSVSLQPGQYLLVQEASGGATGSQPPTPDVTDSTAINMSGTAGKVALVAGTTSLGCNGESTPCDSAALARIVDLIGYGGANFFEGASAAPALSNATAALRAANGCTDTDNNGADFAAGSPAPRNSASPVHLCGGGDAAPSVASTTPANGATDVPVDSNLTVTFSEPVSLSGNPFGLSCSASGTNSVTVSGGQTTYTLNPASDFQLGETCTATVSAAQVTDVDVDDPPDNMATDFSWSFSTVNPAPSCDDPQTHLISQVQGSGPTSPVVNTEVTVEAVITADRTGSDRLSGFFIQEEAADQDSDPATSEGVFVRTSLPAGAGEGDVVQVTGTVREFTGSGSSQTQISSGVTVLLCGGGVLPPAATLEFPVDDVTDFERYEGMRVTMPQTLVISEYFNFDRFNEVVVGLPLEGRDRFFTPTAVVDPGTAANELAAEYAKRRITIDDARGSQNASPPIFPGTVDTPFALANRFRGGDTLKDVTGVVEHTFGLYRVHPTADAAYTRVNDRPDPPVVGGDVQVGSFNVLNYFLTLDNAGPRCGPNENQDCRGADNAIELQRQRAKIVDAISRLDADVVGLMEMENTTGVEPAADLAAGLNDLLGGDVYGFVDTGVIGTDAIRTGFLYQKATVRPVGDFAVLDSSVDPRFLDTRNRPALAQTFDEVASGDRFTVAVNHLKSKGSACNDIGDPDLNDGQGNCNLTRTAAAEALADWLATDPTQSGDPDRLIIGDLNSYDHEDPITALTDAGYTDLVKDFGGEYAYGYVFDGQVGYLDHGLANPSLRPQVTGAAEWHLNADEPDILDYDTSFKGPNEDALYEPNAYRSSDHDAVLIGLTLDSATPEACYTDGSQSVHSFDQGVRKNGTAVPPSMSDPTQALGLSDPGPDPYWAGLGLGGEIVIEFARPVQSNNLTAADLRIVDAPDGARGRADRADVYTSIDGSTWVKAGTVTGTGTVDLDGPIAARYVKVVDTTPTAGLPNSADGYDLDAIEVLTGCAG
jgi:predicted extracellular nuclease